MDLDHFLINSFSKVLVIVSVMILVIVLVCYNKNNFSFSANFSSKLVFYSCTHSIILIILESYTKVKNYYNLVLKKHQYFILASCSLPKLNK